MGTLVVLLVLGAMAVWLPLLAADGGEHPAGRAAGSPPVPAAGVAPPTGIAGREGVGAAAATCRTDYDAAEDAVASFEFSEGHLPATMGELRLLLGRALRTTGFTITIDPKVPGRLEVAAPGHPASPGDGNCRYAH